MNNVVVKQKVAKIAIAKSLFDVKHITSIIVADQLCNNFEL